MSNESETVSFLIRLKETIETALEKPELLTVDFVAICDHLIPVFDDLGLVFCFAKKEFSSKSLSLSKVVDEFVTLKKLVDTDKQMNRVNVKGSCARNLHRLGSALMFITILMQELTKSLNTSLKDAAHVAYEKALAPIHTKILQGFVFAGLLSLPSRESFLKNVNETEETAKERVIILVPLVEQLVTRIHALYDEPMPVSDAWFIPS